MVDLLLADPHHPGTPFHSSFIAKTDFFIKNEKKKNDFYIEEVGTKLRDMQSTSTLTRIRYKRLDRFFEIKLSEQLLLLFFFYILCKFDFFFNSKNFKFACTWVCVVFITQIYDCQDYFRS